MITCFMGISNWIADLKNIYLSQLNNYKYFITLFSSLLASLASMEIRSKYSRWPWLMMVINHYKDPEYMNSKANSEFILTYKHYQKLN